MLVHTIVTLYQSKTAIKRGVALVSISKYQELNINPYDFYVFGRCLLPAELISWIDLSPLVAEETVCGPHLLNNYLGVYRSHKLL